MHLLSSPPPLLIFCQFPANALYSSIFRASNPLGWKEMETKAAQATNNTGLMDILEQVHAFCIQNDNFESMKSNKL